MVLTDLGASLLARLRNQSKVTGLSYQGCLQLFCQEEFLRRLSLSRFNQNFILKGGLFIYTLTEFNSRATQDIDFLINNLSSDSTKIEEIMIEISQVNTNNTYIKLELQSIELITPDREYQGVSIKFVGLIKHVRVPFSIDIGVDDVFVPHSIKRRIKTRLEGFDEPEIYTYSLESTIAEKFDSILKRMEATSRMKDFFDIYYLSNLYDFNGSLLQKAIWSTIKHRNTEFDIDCFERIMKFKENSIMLSQWARFKPLVQLDLPSFEIVLNQIEKFIRPVFEASIHDNEYTMTWLSETCEWW